MQKLRGNFFVNSYVKPQWLTHDPARVESYRTDPLITRPISVRVLLACMKRLTASSPMRRPSACRCSCWCPVPTSWCIAARRTASTSACPARSRSACTCRASSTTRWVNSIAHRHWRASAASSRRVSPNRCASCHGAMRTATGRPSKSPRSGLATAAQQPGRPALARGAWRPAFRWPVVRRHRAGPADRFRFGQHAGLHLPRRSTRQGPVGADDRPQLPGRDRLAGHSRAWPAPAGTAARRCTAPARASKCVRPPPGIRAGSAPTASCCATSAI